MSQGDKALVQITEPGGMNSRGAAPMKLFEATKDLRQTLSWKLGYGRGKAGRDYRCPWWADPLVFAAAYMQGRRDGGKPRRPAKR